jgi:hypothetical protein
MHRDSWNAWLVEFEVGERRYVETTLEGFANDMRTINTPRSRRPAELDGREFSAALFTAVSNSRAGDVRYVLCIEREA